MGNAPSRSTPQKSSTSSNSSQNVSPNRLKRASSSRDKSDIPKSITSLIDLVLRPEDQMVNERKSIQRCLASLKTRFNRFNGDYVEKAHLEELGRKVVALWLLVPEAREILGCGRPTVDKAEGVWSSKIILIDSRCKNYAIKASHASFDGRLELHERQICQAFIEVCDRRLEKIRKTLSSLVTNGAETVAPPPYEV